MRLLAGDRRQVLKKADKGSWAVVWDRLDYLIVAGNQIIDNKVCQEVMLTEDILIDLVEKKEHND